MMENLMDVIKNRRSIRHFVNREVPREALNQVLEAVQWSPSWANTQCWEVVVVKSPEVKQRLQETMSKGNPATKAIVEAPLVLALCGKLKSSGFYKDQVTTKFGDWFMFDLGIATQSLCLAAHNQGLGTVIAGLFDHDKAKDVLQVPDGYELVSLIPMGYPARGSGAPKRREIAEFTHYDRF
jgi:nitroreductase